MKTLSTINIWLLENEEYYEKISGICKMPCKDCEDKHDLFVTGEKCVRKVYENEFKFYNYYKSLVLLLELQKISDVCKELVDEYNALTKDNIQLIDSWCLKALPFSDAAFENYNIETHIVYHNKTCIGIRPNYSELYKENPFLVPVDGFENLIEFQKIFNKEFTITKIPLFENPTYN